MIADAGAQCGVVRRKGALLLDQISHHFPVFLHITLKKEKSTRTQLGRKQIDKRRRKESFNLMLCLPPGIWKENVHSIHTTIRHNTRQIEAGIVVTQP